MSPLPSLPFISSSQEGLSQRRGRSARSHPPGLLLYGTAFPRPPHHPPPPFLPRGFVGTAVLHGEGCVGGGVLLTQRSTQCSRGRNKAERGQMHRAGACAAWCDCPLCLAGWWPGDGGLPLATGPGSSACFPPTGAELRLPWKKKRKGMGRPPEPASLIEHRWNSVPSALWVLLQQQPPPHTHTSQTPPAPLTARGITPHR